ncbi:hypothetical protein AB0F77_28425 [Streptomyces sp. NPDC026672]|uniref:hypothetical protein n=1 Tax=unclassified Streptomyces TaxID=2593676 RepID=UPI0033DF836C
MAKNNSKVWHDNHAALHLGFRYRKPAKGQIAMTQLLNRVLNAHGGLERWRNATTIQTRASFGGPMWELRGVAGLLNDNKFTIDLKQQHTVISDFTGPGIQGVYTPNHVALVDKNGRILRERHAPRKSFEGFQVNSPWDELHLLFFVGYAMWNYLTAPYLLTLPGVLIQELSPDPDTLDLRPPVSGTWHRLRVNFPQQIETHSREQTFYYDDLGLQRRMDYRVEVAGGGRGAHFTEGHQEVSGLIFPTHRYILIPDADGTSLREEPFITVDLSDIQVN